MGPENISETEQLSELSEFSEVIALIVQTIMAQSVMKNSVARILEGGSDRSISSEVSSGEVSDQESLRLLLKFIMSG